LNGRLSFTDGNQIEDFYLGYEKNAVGIPTLKFAGLLLQNHSCGGNCIKKIILNPKTKTP